MSEEFPDYLNFKAKLSPAREFMKVGDIAECAGVYYRFHGITPDGKMRLEEIKIHKLKVSTYSPGCLELDE